MKVSEKSTRPVLAAGGIVVRDGAEPLIAIVRLRKNKAWVLPKGKLKPGEDMLGAARREAMEETGHDVSVHEYLGTISETASGRPKVVQFWRMRAVGGPARKPMDDVKAVEWLPLEHAVAMLTYAHEQAFLAQVGPFALQAASAREMPAGAAAVPAPAEAGGPAAGSTFMQALRSWLRRLTQPA